MATPSYRLHDDGETAGTPPTPSADDDLDLATPDALASFGDADAGKAGSGSLYDPTEDPAVQGQFDAGLTADANLGNDALDDADLQDPATLDGRRLDVRGREDHGLGGYGEHGASDEVLGDLTGDDADFGPGSGHDGRHELALRRTGRRPSAPRRSTWDPPRPLDRVRGGSEFQGAECASKRPRKHRARRAGRRRPRSA